MEQHRKDPRAIVLPKVVMAFQSKNGYHTFNCPACDRRNKAHEKRAINYVPLDHGAGGEPIPEHHKGETMHFSCVGCHREIHVSRCPDGGLIVL